MTITIDLPAELERELEAEAARLGIAVTEYATRLITETRPANGRQYLSGAELVEYWEREGVIGSRLDIEDSTAHARQIRQVAEQRRRE
ncbi:MAG TPA: hypothetical protein VFJ50_00250 [Gemmatimonadales bacterium]|nr:hypothetical protein [Gemmatimonadales bacterium]